MLTERFESPQTLGCRRIFIDVIPYSVSSFTNTSGEESTANVYGLELMFLNIWPNLLELFQYEIDIDPFYLPQVLGRPWSATPDKTMYHHGIIRENTEPPGFAAARARGTNFFNALQLLGAWNFRSATGKVPGEHAVVHSKFDGSVTTSRRTSELMRDPDHLDRYSHKLSVETVGTYLDYFFIDHDTLFPSFGRLFDHYPSLRSRSLNGDFNHEADNPPNMYSSSPSHFSGEVLDYYCEFSGTVLTHMHLSVDTEVIGTNGGGYRWGYDFDIYPVNSFLSYDLPVDDGTVDLHDLYDRHIQVIVTQRKCEYSYTLNTDHPSWVNFGSAILSLVNPSVGSSTWYRAKYYQSFPRTDTFSAESSYITGSGDFSPQQRGVLAWMYNEPSDGSRSRKRKRLHSLDYLVENDLVNLYPGLVLSQNDALNTSFETLGLNSLEIAGDLFEIRSLLGSFGTSVEFIRNLNKHAKSPLELLDFLTDQKLLLSFAIAPTADDVKTIVSKAQKVRKFYLNLKPREAIRGRFDFSFDGFNVVFRSKVVIKNDTASQLLGALLPIRAAGLLPNFQNIWNLVKFSFVADWAFNIDDRFEMIDDRIVLGMFDVDYAVHSIHITRPISATEFEPYGFSPNGNDVVYSYFCRGISDTLLNPGSTRFDFTPATGPTDLTVAGSLFYKILRR